MTETSQQAQQLIDEAEQRKPVLLVDHTFIYTGAVRKMASSSSAASSGRVYYYDSIRVNLGLFQRDVSVISDLAVHDFSILDYLARRAAGRRCRRAARTTFPGTPENLAYITLFYESGIIAHANVSWLAPVKVRQILVGGSKKMITYDDLEPSEKIKIYDKGVSFTDDPREDPGDARRLPHRRHVGAQARRRPRRCSVEGEHFVDCIVTARCRRPTAGSACASSSSSRRPASSMRGKGETVYMQNQRKTA